MAKQRQRFVGDIQRQKEINTEITQTRTVEKMNPRLTKNDLVGGNKKPGKKNAFAEKSKK